MIYISNVFRYRNKIKMELNNTLEDKNLSIQHSLIVSRIEDKIKSYQNLVKILYEMPDESILVGGFIRDIILDRLNPYPDIDIVLPRNSIEFGKSISEKYSGKFLILDQDRKIVRIIFSNYIIDLANKTHELLDEDLKTRDLTINSIGFSLDKRKLIDPANGIYDLNNSLLRSLRNENLLSDPLRILRCFRFMSELNFHIEPNILEFIELNKFQLKYVSVERIQYELKKIVYGKEAYKTVEFLNKIKIFDWIQSYENNNSNKLIFANFDNFFQDEIDRFFPIAYLKELLKEPVIKKFKFSKADSLAISSLRRWTQKLTQKSIMNFTEIERFQLHKDLEMILPAFIVYLPKKYHKEWLHRWRNNKDKLFHPRKFINGNQLKNIVGIEDGPLLGDLLNYLSREFAYERLNNFDEAIYKAKGWFQQNAPKCD